jgi:hypothetical protein
MGSNQKQLIQPSNAIFMLKNDSFEIPSPVELMVTDIKNGS